MKNFALLAAIALIALACQDDRDSGSNTTSNLGALNKEVGGKVDAEKALRWMENGDKAGLNANINYAISQSNLIKAMESAENIYGMVFHYGIDEQGTQHIILTPVAEDFKTWKGIVIDANTDGEINASRAHAWIQNFDDANDEITPRQHIYGINIFKEIAEYAGFDIVRGINDERIPQILLVMKSASGLGRSKSDGGPVYDQSRTCPPYCPK